MRMTTRNLLAVTTGLLLCAGVPALAQNTAAPAGQPPAAGSDQGGAAGGQGTMGTEGTSGSQGTMAPTPKKRTHHVRRHKPSTSASTSGAGTSGTEGGSSSMGAGGGSNMGAGGSSSMGTGSSGTPPSAGSTGAPPK